MVFLYIAGLCVLVAWFVLKLDKRYRNKNFKETVKSEDLKAYLNMPHQKAHFDQDLNQIQQKKDLSRKLLDEFNSND